MPDDPLPYPVTDDHCRAFGAIIQQFARHERLMEIAIAALLRARVGPAGIVTAGLGYAGKRDALQSLITRSTMLRETANNIVGFLDKLNSRAGLRNAIAHNVWKEGRRKGSIKPLGVTARGGTGKIWGIRHNEPSYTVAELVDIANEIAALYNSFRSYLDSLGLIAIDRR